MNRNDRVSQAGCDVHRTFSMMTTRDKDNQLLWRQRLDHRDREAMRKSLEALPPGTPVVLESSFGWGWMSDELTAAKLTPRLAHARKVAKWREARGLAKSDRVDSDLLSELPSQTPPWWEVWLAPPKVQQQREWLRHRMSLTQLQTRLKNQIHAVLHRHGVLHEFTDLFGVKGRRFLDGMIEEPIEKKSNKQARPDSNETLVNNTGAQKIVLPTSARTTIRQNLQLLDHVRRQLACVLRELRRQVRSTPAGERMRRIPGIGWVLSYTILAEIGDVRRFGSAKRLCSYSLLAPIAWDSGKEDPDDPPQGRHVGFMGRRTLKWAFIQAAHSAIRKPGRFRDIYDRRTNGGKRDRNRGLIAVAHELCRLVYVVWMKEVNYTETPPTRPGSRPAEATSAASAAASTVASESIGEQAEPAKQLPSRKKRTKSGVKRQTSRSVKGQPDVAMVAAE